MADWNKSFSKTQYGYMTLYHPAIWLHELIVLAYNEESSGIYSFHERRIYCLIKVYWSHYPATALTLLS